MELFKRLLDRYNYEFEIQGKTVYMHHQIGNDTNFIYKHKLNASNISESINASNFFTYIRGFGDYEDGEEDYEANAKLQDDFLHPVADIVGVWEGAPVKDGRIKNISTLKEAMKTAVEDSLEITIEGTLHDIRHIYDVAVPQKGDRVNLQDDRLEMDREIRLYKIVTTEDERNNVIKCDVTFGSQSSADAYKSSLNSLSKRFADLLLGKLKLPVISLEQIGMDMINAIHAASSEIIFGDFGMMAISKENPNNVFGLNSEGWYISQDGGRTPKIIATAKGILADALYAGTLWLTNEMNIESADGYLNVTGSRFVMRSKNNSDAYVEISPDGIIVSEGFMTIYGKDGRIVMEDGYMRGSRVANIIDFYTGSIVSFQGRNLMWDSYDNQRVKYIDDQYKGRFLDLVIATGLSERSKSTSAHAIVTVRDFPGTVVASERFLIRRQNDGAEMDFRRIRCDLQALFNNVPDYRTVSLYLEVQLDSAYSGNEILFRINKGEFHA